jgi:hypothetical protein
VPTLDRSLVAVEHLSADAQRLLEPLEALADGRVGDAQAGVLLLVPRGPDPKNGPPSGEHVQGGHRLGENAGVAVGHAGHHGPQLDPLGEAGGIGERGVALRHVQLGRADHGDLEEVVHHPQAGQADLVTAPGDPGKGRGDRAGRARPAEEGDLGAEAHAGILPPGIHDRRGRAARALPTWHLDDTHQPTPRPVEMQPQGCAHTR